MIGNVIELPPIYAEMAYQRIKGEAPMFVDVDVIDLPATAPTYHEW